MRLSHTLTLTAMLAASTLVAPLALADAAARGTHHLARDVAAWTMREAHAGNPSTLP